MPPFHGSHHPGPSLSLRLKTRIIIDWQLRGRNSLVGIRSFCGTSNSKLLRTPCPDHGRHHNHQHVHHNQCRIYQTSSAAATSKSSPSTTGASRSLILPPSSPTTLSRRTSTSTLYTKLVAMATQQQTRSHSGHGHSHGHHHHHHHGDNVYLTSRNKNDAGVRITRIGLFSNLGMAIAKGAGGYMFNSQAMVADAWHSMTDLASDVLTLATVSVSLRPPTDRFPTGFGKIESLGSLGVSGMLLIGGLFMCYSSLGTLYAHLFLDPSAAAEFMAHGHHHGHSHGHGHGHGHGHLAPSLNAAWLAAGTVIVKEWLYHATMKVARERKSSVLASNAVHHRVDSLTGIVTLLVILGANFWRNAEWLDPTGGLLISLLVIRAGFGNTVAAFQELADRGLDEEVKQSVTKHVGRGLSALEDCRHDEVELRGVAGVKSGQNYLVDLELAVPKAWTVEECRVVEDAVRTQVGGKVRGVRRVRVRFVPREQDGEEARRFDEFIPGDVEPAPEEVEDDDHHDHNHSNGNGKGHHKSQ
ncbi:uncharacterized protein PgNI_10006 [Pyricularia grisea]|uniref:Cation efflux protein transmembrane domain-containing protein n=1 Tax=Pyricularia grisea TaxID=148305 RepID=A0A6P8AS45_PYRGI|nr:uncharacterized protein PgNI_10006 [Pyricularia grisea]TLD04933.1 hypothetical protein PgNI_10006 [Pyricularia grisea]